MSIKERDAANLAKERVAKTYKSVKNVKEEDRLFKCIRWAQECINKCKNDAMTVKGKERSSDKAVSAKSVTVRKF